MKGKQSLLSVLGVVCLAGFSIAFFIGGMYCGFHLGKGTGKAGFLSGETYVIDWMQGSVDRVTHKKTYYVTAERVEKYAVTVGDAQVHRTEGVEFYAIPEKNLRDFLGNSQVKFILPGMPPCEDRSISPTQQ